MENSFRRGEIPFNDYRPKINASVDDGRDRTFAIEVCADRASISELPEKL
jgi:hypothetical protein